MFRTAIVTAVFLSVFSMVFPEDFKHFNLFLSLTTRGVGGKTADDVKNGLTPKGDSMGGVNFGINADYFFLKNFGLTGGYDFQGPVSVSSHEVKSPLNVFNISIYRLGAAGRIYFYDSPDTQIFTYVKCYAGADMGFLNLHDDYKSLISNSAAKNGYSVSFYPGNATGIGFFGGINLEYSIGIVILGGGIYAESYSLKFQEASGSMNFFNFAVPLFFGITF